MQRTNRTWRATLEIAACALALITLTACSDRRPPSFQGYVEGEFVSVSSPVGGRLDRLMVSRGQQVSIGMPLFALESESEAAALRQAQERLGSAQAHLRDLKAGKRPLELDVIKAQHTQAVAQARNSSLTLKRYEELYKRESIPLARLDEARAKADSDEARVREIKDELAVAALPARTEQIRAQSASVAADEAAVEQARWRLDQKAVKATSSGPVQDTLFREGEWVPAGDPVLRMLPPGNVKVRFFVPESLVGSISVGQGVTVRADGLDSEIPAKVTFVSLEPEYTPPVIYSNETRSKLVFMLEAHPEQADAAKLHPGQPVAVRLK